MKFNEVAAREQAAIESGKPCFYSVDQDGTWRWIKKLDVFCERLFTVEFVDPYMIVEYERLARDVGVHRYIAIATNGDGSAELGSLRNIEMPDKNLPRMTLGPYWATYGFVLFRAEYHLPQPGDDELCIRIALYDEATGRIDRQIAIPQGSPFYDQYLEMVKRNIADRKRPKHEESEMVARGIGLTDDEKVRAFDILSEQAEVYRNGAGDSEGGLWYCLQQATSAVLVTRGIRREVAEHDAE